MHARVAAAGLALMAMAPHAPHAPVMHVVRVSGFRFEPETLTVAPGDSVRWVNADILRHTATADDSSFGTPELPTDSAATAAAPAAGIHPYHCDAHPVMRGVLVVR